MSVLAPNVEAQEQIIAFWDFNDGFDLRPDDPLVDPLPVQISHAASLGSGTLNQQRAEIDGNGKGEIRSWISF